MKDAVTGLAGALGAAVLGVLTLVVRRLMWGKREDEALATKAAHQAVEAVDDALAALRREIAELRVENTSLRAEAVLLRAADSEKGTRIVHLEAQVKRLELAGGG